MSYRSDPFKRPIDMGGPFESYVKDWFCDSFDLKKKEPVYNKYFSYIGKQNHPPDLMLRGGDALEIKQIGNLRSKIMLNGSHPRGTLYSNSPALTKACKHCENWKKKKLIYIIGVAKKNTLKGIWCVSGSCYSANEKTYKKIIGKMRRAIKKIRGLKFSKSRELGRIAKTDPLSITHLRVCARWSIDNPSNVFRETTTPKKTSVFFLKTILLKNQYFSYPKKDRENLEKLKNPYFSLKDVEIKSPNKPKRLLKAKLLVYQR